MSLAIEAFVENARHYCRWLESSKHDIEKVRQLLLALMQGIPYLIVSEKEGEPERDFCGGQRRLAHVSRPFRACNGPLNPCVFASLRLCVKGFANSDERHLTQRESRNQTEEAQLRQTEGKAMTGRGIRGSGMGKRQPLELIPLPLIPLPILLDCLLRRKAIVRGIKASQSLFPIPLTIIPLTNLLQNERLSTIALQID